MTLLDPGQSADTPTKEHHSGLIAVVAILAVVLLALGAWLVVPGQHVGYRRLMGGLPLSALWRRSVL